MNKTLLVICTLFSISCFSQEMELKREIETYTLQESRDLRVGAPVLEVNQTKIDLLIKKQLKSFNEFDRIRALRDKIGITGGSLDHVDIEKKVRIVNFPRSPERGISLIGNFKLSPESENQSFVGGFSLTL